ncbi:probable ATP-dependent RNA helicase DDX59 [Nematostella vectensis]|uniref:probable ATP-dependent RNA helicase DDX59 n=1 Tax=Nematostella vectensis TaxID=45351 RepID=UPI00207798DD|nr:probable ATP-dependent RNA helicase DDX59 [Nematostella vectensis]XP_032222306.2 probable ATP-dependent RNA helicase DDX59 [Nematostella vectensis]XP_032222307.2 probable ATP-dependent RNA helicase DDX59 [Nematostella vectensis]
MAAFIPRVVQRKPGKSKPNIATTKTRKGPQVSSSENRVQMVDLRSGKDNVDKEVEEPKCEPGHGRREDDDDDVDEEVVSFSKNQRWPEYGEPVCVVCGRYGAYVCDQTEQDICSLECKARHLRDIGQHHNQEESSNVYNETDECQKNERDNLIYTDSNYTYKEHPTIAALTAEQVKQLRDKMEIKVKGEHVVSPVLEFFHCSFNESLSKNLSNHGYHSPTPIQMQVLPVLLSGRDVMVCASTGSGKTASFLLPMISRIHHITGKLLPSSPEVRFIYGLILAPTRELCMQIEKQTKEFVHGMTNMRTALLIGGVPVPPQLHRLKMGVQVIVATPGRMVEIISRQAVDLTHVIGCVVDEVDTMLQLGFEQQVQQILERLSNRRQTMLFSATIPPSIEAMASRLLNAPVFISAGSPSLPTKAVKQLILWVEEKSKKKQLFSILKDSRHFNPPAVVFVESKLGADMLAEAVSKVCHIKCLSMHGDKPQAERAQILQDFLAGECPLVVSTAVLGRGVDLLNIRQVINFDMPPTYEEYVHQIGRAGRLGATGWSISFINNASKGLFLQLINKLQPMGVKLPDELTRSAHVLDERCRASNSRKRAEKDEIVNQSNLMDLIVKRKKNK